MTRYASRGSNRARTNLISRMAPEYAASFRRARQGLRRRRKLWKDVLMSEEARNVSQMPGGRPDDGAALGALLETARELVSQEIERGDRLEGKARNQFAAVGAIFAVAIATVGALMNVLATEKHIASWVYPLVGGCSVLAGVLLLIAFVISIEAWRPQESGTISPETLLAYVPHAEKGRPAVTRQLVNGYAAVLAKRLAANEKRLTALKSATSVCIIAALASMAALVSILVAVANQ